MESYLLLAENGSEVRIWMIISILYFMKSEIEKEIFFLVCNRQDWATKQQWIIKKKNWFYYCTQNFRLKYEVIFLLKYKRFPEYEKYLFYNNKKNFSS